MNTQEFRRKNVILSAAAVTSIALLLAINTVWANPTQAPPNGNPAFPAGLQGPTGNQGGQGNQGNQGNQGSTGPQGANGWYGIGYCNWNGPFWISHGWDSGCAWDVGAYFYCDGTRMYSIQWTTNRDGNSYLCGTGATP